MLPDYQKIDFTYREEVFTMQKQTVHFAVVSNNGVVSQICNSFIRQIKPNYNGKGVKWYEDKLKKVKR